MCCMIVLLEYSFILSQPSSIYDTAIFSLFYIDLHYYSCWELFINTNPSNVIHSLNQWFPEWAVLPPRGPWRCAPLSVLLAYL
jgi:hypothetical protein